VTWENIIFLRNKAAQSISMKCNNQCVMTQQQRQLTNSRISTLQLHNKQTDRSVRYIYSHVLRASDDIKNFVFRDKDLRPKAKDFVIKASRTCHCLSLKNSCLSICSVKK